MARDRESTGNTVRPQSFTDDASRWLLGLCVAVTLAGLGVVVLLLAGLNREPQWQACRDLVQQRRLTAPAWLGAGQPTRAPELLHPAVDLRHLPGLFPFDYQPGALLVRSFPHHAWPLGTRPATPAASASR